MKNEEPESEPRPAPASSQKTGDNDVPDGYIPPERRDDTALQSWEYTVAQLTRPVADLAIQSLQASSSTSGRPCVVLDVGANVGTFAAQVTAQRPDCFVYAFEPVAELFSYTTDKFALNPKVIVEHAALCDNSGTAMIYRNATGNKGWNTMNETRGRDTRNGMIPETITCLRWDDYANAEGPGRPLPGAPGFLKIDVEGHEWGVIRGMHQHFATWEASRQLPVMAVEIGFGVSQHSKWVEEAKEFEWLFAHGYERIDYKVATTTDVVLRPIA